MSEYVKHPDQKQFDELLQNNPLVLVDFWATWCAPCRMVAPIIEQLAEEYQDKIVVAKVDIDEHPEVAQQFGVQSIPTIMLFKQHKVIATDVGAKPIRAYREMINANLS